MSGERMQRFWDERAEEDPFYFVDNRLSYRNPDMDTFWAEGDAALDLLCELLNLQIGPGGTVLDIGCGVGRLSRALATRVDRVIGLDVSERMLERARELNAEVDGLEWVHGDGHSFAGVDDASVDGCISLVVFQHIPDPSVTLGYIREMGRVLTPGGWGAFQVSTDPTIHRKRVTLRDRVMAALGRAPSGQHDPSWLGSPVTVADVERAAREGGMEVEAVRGAGTQYCSLLVRRGPSGGNGRPAADDAAAKP